MFNPEQLLKQMVGGALGNALGGRSRSKGVLGSLGIGKAQLGIGLLGVAMAAYQHYNSSQRSSVNAAVPTAPASFPAASFPVTPPPPPPMNSPDTSAATRAQPVLDERQREAALLIRAMIAAAAADGLIDAQEHRDILSRAQALGDNADTLSFLDAELRHPVTVEQLIAQTPRSLAETVYAASALAITLDTDAERAWLDRLANGLELDTQQRNDLHARIGLS